MTEKDFDQLAKVFKRELDMAFAGKDRARVNILCDTARILASDIALNHPRFNRSQFLDACGVPA